MSKDGRGPSAPAQGAPRSAPPRTAGEGDRSNCAQSFPGRRLSLHQV